GWRIRRRDLDMAVAVAVGSILGPGYQLVHFVAHQRVLFNQRLGDRDNARAVLLEQHLDALEVLVEHAVYLATATHATAATEGIAGAQHAAIRHERPVHAIQLDHHLGDVG